MALVPFVASAFVSACVVGCAAGLYMHLGSFWGPTTQTGKQLVVSRDALLGAPVRHECVVTFCRDGGESCFMYAATVSHAWGTCLLLARKEFRSRAAALAAAAREAPLARPFFLYDVQGVCYPLLPIDVSLERSLAGLYTAVSWVAAFLLVAVPVFLTALISWLRAAATFCLQV